MHVYSCMYTGWWKPTQKVIWNIGPCGKTVVTEISTHTWFKAQKIFSGPSEILSFLHRFFRDCFNKKSIHSPLEWQIKPIPSFWVFLKGQTIIEFCLFLPGLNCMIVINNHSVEQFCIIIGCSEHLFLRQFDKRWEHVFD